MKRALAVILLLTLLLSVGIGAGAASSDAADYLIIHYIDVDQADGMLLIAGDTTVLIDAGNLATSNKMVAYLQRFGVTELDLVVNTHPHMDHMGGISSVMRPSFPARNSSSTTEQQRS